MTMYINNQESVRNHFSLNVRHIHLLFVLLYLVYFCIFSLNDNGVLQ